MSGGNKFIKLSLASKKIYQTLSCTRSYCVGDMRSTFANWVWGKVEIFFFFFGRNSFEKELRLVNKLTVFHSSSNILNICLFQRVISFLTITKYLTCSFILGKEGVVASLSVSKLRKRPNFAEGCLREIVHLCCAVQTSNRLYFLLHALLRYQPTSSVFNIHFYTFFCTQIFHYSV